MPPKGYASRIRHGPKIGLCLESPSRSLFRAELIAFYVIGRCVRHDRDRMAAVIVGANRSTRRARRNRASRRRCFSAGRTTDSTARWASRSCSSAVPKSLRFRFASPEMQGREPRRCELDWAGEQVSGLTSEQHGSLCRLLAIVEKWPVARGAQGF
jgi:hypothetical protein